MKGSPSQLKAIRQCWTLPDDWKIKIDDTKMFVSDNEDDIVIEAMTHIEAIRSIEKHLVIQAEWGALKVMLNSAKKSAES